MKAVDWRGGGCAWPIGHIDLFEFFWIEHARTVSTDYNLVQSCTSCRLWSNQARCWIWCNRSLSDVNRLCVHRALRPACCFTLAKTHTKGNWLFWLFFLIWLRRHATVFYYETGINEREGQQSTHSVTALEHHAVQGDITTRNWAKDYTNAHAACNVLSSCDWTAGVSGQPGNPSKYAPAVICSRSGKFVRQVGLLCTWMRRGSMPITPSRGNDTTLVTLETRISLMKLYLAKGSAW